MTGYQPCHRPRRRPRFQRGQSISEYLVVLVLIAGVFALPGDGGAPLLIVFADAIGSGFARFFRALSLPL